MHTCSRSVSDLGTFYSRDQERFCKGWPICRKQSSCLVLLSHACAALAHICNDSTLLIMLGQWYTGAMAKQREMLGSIISRAPCSHKTRAEISHHQTSPNKHQQDIVTRDSHHCGYTGSDAK